MDYPSTMFRDIKESIKLQYYERIGGERLWKIIS